MKHAFFAATFIEEGVLGDIKVAVSHISVVKHKVSTLGKSLHHKLNLIGKPHIILIAKKNLVAVTVSYSVCEVCNIKTEEKIPSIEHTYGEAVVTKEATENETGVKTSTCTVCGTTKEEEIPCLLNGNNKWWLLG